MLYGEEQILNAKLEVEPNPSPGKMYQIEFTCPEFTCLCPRSGFPDFATIHINYIPNEKIIELKSLKLYINGYRNKYMFHEAVVNVILEDLVKILDPNEIEVVGDFNVRGNIKTVIRAKHKKE